MRQVAKARLRDDIVDQLAQLIGAGELTEVERLKEIELAGQLGVSRTPLREALLILERDGLVVSEANKGFRVAPLSEVRVRELFPILGALEALAVRTGGDVLVERVPELRAANKQIKAGTGGKRYLLDRRWHELLWSGNPNRTLVDKLRRLWLEATRFDGNTARGMANPSGSIDEHAEITELIGKGQLAKAGKLVDEHWLGGIDVVIGWLRTRRIRTAS